MLFREVIGHEALKHRLISSVQQNRVPHAQLFLGPEGCGNLPMALAFAQYLNCESPGNTDSCGQCPSCQKALKNIHPDIHFTFPFIAISTGKKEEIKEKCADWLPEWRTFLQQQPYGNYNNWINFIQKENKQGNINAKECGDIIHRLSFKTFESSWKVLVLWLPEFLEKEGNRLLKLIEEPPEQTIFLFVGHNPDRIINTILSRLQIVPFGRLQEDEVAWYLQEEQGVPAQSARQVAVLSNGNIARAAELVQVSQESYTSTLRQWMLACHAYEITEMFAWNEQFIKWGREQQKQFFFYCIHFFREVYLMQHGAAVLNRLTEDEMNFAQKLGGKLSAASVERIMELFDTYIYFIERNASARILITQMTVSFAHFFHRHPADIRHPFYAEWEL